MSRDKQMLRFIAVKNHTISAVLAKFLWKSKAPSKLKAFSWLVLHEKVNINNMLQLRRSYNSLCPHWCILCMRSGELIDHLFLCLFIKIESLTQAFQSSQDELGFAQVYM
ncbi:unnamed protein product, partial [Vitis vinifera]